MWLKVEDGIQHAGGSIGTPTVTVMLTVIIITIRKGDGGGQRWSMVEGGQRSTVVGG